MGVGGLSTVGKAREEPSDLQCAAVATCVTWQTWKAGWMEPSQGCGDGSSGEPGASGSVSEAQRQLLEHHLGMHQVKLLYCTQFQRLLLKAWSWSAPTKQNTWKLLYQPQRHLTQGSGGKMPICSAFDSSGPDLGLDPVPSGGSD